MRIEKSFQVMCSYLSRTRCSTLFSIAEHGNRPALTSLRNKEGFTGSTSQSCIGFDEPYYYKMLSLISDLISMITELVLLCTMCQHGGDKGCSPCYVLCQSPGFLCGEHARHDHD